MICQWSFIRVVSHQGGLLVFHQGGLSVVCHQGDVSGLSSGWSLSGLSSGWSLGLSSGWSLGLSSGLVSQLSFIRMVSQWYLIWVVISVVFHQGDLSGISSRWSQGGLPSGVSSTRYRCSGLCYSALCCYRRGGGRGRGTAERGRGRHQR